jgi:hypothetical protein
MLYREIIAVGLHTTPWDPNGCLPQLLPPHTRLSTSHRLYKRTARQLWAKTKNGMHTSRLAQKLVI